MTNPIDDSGDREGAARSPVAGPCDLSLRLVFSIVSILSRLVALLGGVFNIVNAQMPKTQMKDDDKR